MLFEYNYLPPQNISEHNLMEENVHQSHQYSGRGAVFNIQRWAIQDGPGMRTTVFLKGCPLRCGWCANPESQNRTPQIMTRDILCIGCGKCVEVCPQNVIRLSKALDKETADLLQKQLPSTAQTQKVVRSIDWTSCNQCLRCADVCPAKAIIVSGAEQSVQEVMDKVSKDRGFYQRSNGGMTISGGEPLTQWRFALDLLKIASEQGIHTALDTAGFAKWEVLEQLLRHTDLLLYDIKNTDSVKHGHQTGVGNELIIDNLKRALKQNRVWIRRAIIPGFNDSVKETESFARFIASLDPLPEKISLLPYHGLAQSKYQSMGRAYDYQDTQPLKEGRLPEIKALLESASPVPVDIGR